MKPVAMPLVSIVTPSFNQAAFLATCMQSVLSQDYPRLEYTVVDGGSTDGSVDVIQRHARELAWWVSEKDAGQTDAINKGFSRASGSILAWLNSDDAYRPGAVGEAARFLHDHPEVGMVYANADYVDAEGRVIGRFPAAQTDYRRLRRGYVHIPQQAAFFRSELWREVGPLDPTFFFAMDYDLWIRISARSRIVYLPDRRWAAFRIHSAGKTVTADERCWPEMLRVHYRDGGSLLSPLVAKYYARRLIAPFWRWQFRTRLGLKR